MLTRSVSEHVPLRFTLTKFDGTVHIVKYGQFSVGPESDGYRLLLKDWQGPACDDLLKNCPNGPYCISGRKFTTKDKYYFSKLQRETKYNKVDCF